MDTLYESAQKRTFVSSILLAGAHVPFLIEIIVLYRQLGPKLPDKSQYQQLENQEPE